MDKLLGWFLDLFKKALGFLYGYWRQPRLHIEVAAQDEPFVGLDVGGGMKKCAYYRLAVSNIGKSRAEECEAYLVALDALDEKGSRDLHGRPARLKWAHEEDFKTISIEPNEPPRKLDLFYVYEDDPKSLHPFTERSKMPVGIPSSVQGQKFRATVRVNWKPAGKAVGAFEITWAENYQGFVIQPVRPRR